MTHSVAGHWALWRSGIEQGDVSIGNLMCDPVTKRGFLNDFDLARLSSPNRGPSTTDNTGTLPFLALDLLSERAFKGQVPRLYRHEAESFTWCLIYICICMWKDSKGQIHTRNPHPLLSWSANMDSCLHSKADLAKDGLLDEFPHHQDIGPLATKLFRYWEHRFNSQNEHSSAQTSLKWDGTSRRPKDFEGFLPGLPLEPEEPIQTPEPYEELSDCDRFKEIFQILLQKRDLIPDSKNKIFVDMINSVAIRYPFVTTPKRVTS